MRLRTIAAMLALAGLAQAAAGAPPPAIEEAFEVRVKNLGLPANEFGSVILRPCDTCDPVTLRVEGDTSYVFEGQAMPLKAFREAVASVADKTEATGTVIYRLQDRRVRRIAVDVPLETKDRKSTDGRG